MNTPVYLFFGTTAEYIKLLPVIKGLQKKNIKYRLVLSGQTTVSINSFQQLVGTQTAYKNFDLKLKKPSAFGFGIWSIRTFFSSILWGFSEFRKKGNQHSLVIVQGDTVSALIGGILSKIYGQRLFHVEAGLRTHTLFEPFPEEICRTVIGYLADVHFCPTKSSFSNLPRGKKLSTNINTSMESLSMVLNEKNIQVTHKLPKKFFLFIVHRQEHLFVRKEETKKLMMYIFEQASKNLPCVFLVHDVTKAYLEHEGLLSKLKSMPNVHMTQTLGYLEFVKTLSDAEYIITDGGGNHTECYYLGKPCLIFRRKSEQTEGVGKNVVISEDNPKIILNFMKNYKKYRRAGLKVKQWPSEIIMKEILKLQA